MFVGLLKEAIAANLGTTKGFLIDGYPREVKHAEEFERQVSKVVTDKSRSDSSY